MRKHKRFLCITRPFAHVHDTMTTLGFTPAGARPDCDYSMMFHDPVTRSSYLLHIPATHLRNGDVTVELGRADFTGTRQIPVTVLATAEDLLLEMSDYLRNESDTKELAVMNTMAPNENELKRLGKEMANMPTNSHWIENGYVPDPIP
jgi:hypothetical protein